MMVNSKMKAFALCFLAALPLREGLFGHNANAIMAQPEAVQPLSQSDESQSVDSVRLGFCDDKVEGGIIQGNDVPGEVGGAIFLTPEILAKYEGNVIDRIDFALDKKRGYLATVFVTKELDGKPMSVKTLRSYNKGWNSVKLSNPVKITAGQGIYVGFTVALAEGETNDCLVCDSRPRNGESWYRNNGYWWMVPTILPRNMRVRAYASGGKFPADDASITAFSMNNYVEQNKSEEATFTIFNYGRETITSAEVEFEADGVKFGKTTLGDLNIVHNDVAIVSLPDVKVPVEGNFTINANLLSINGKADEDVADNEKSRNGFAAKEGNQPELRNVLLEHFVTEKSVESAKSDDAYAESLQSEDDYIWVKHHLATAPDQFTLPNEQDYIDLYGGRNPFYPALAIDRQYFTNTSDPGPAYFVDPSMVSSMMSACRRVPSYIRLDVEATVDADGMQVEAVVKGHAGANEMPMQNDLRLTVYLVEDSVVSNQQDGYDTYIHNGIIRKVVTPSWGDELDISAYDFSKTYNVALEGGWNLKNMRVVAFASNYDKELPSYMVYNAAQAFCKTPTAIAALPNDVLEGVKVECANGRIMVSDGFHVESIHSLSGSNVDNGRLMPGVYLVKVGNGTTSKVVKVAVGR